MPIMKYAAAAALAGLLSFTAAHAQEGMVDELRQPTLDSLPARRLSSCRCR
jgi:ribose transport system substrate-binding protein